MIINPQLIPSDYIILCEDSFGAITITFTISSLSDIRIIMVSAIERERVM